MRFKLKDIRHNVLCIADELIDRDNFIIYYFIHQFPYWHSQNV